MGQTYLALQAVADPKSFGEREQDKNSIFQSKYSGRPILGGGNFPCVIESASEYSKKILMCRC